MEQLRHGTGDHRDGRSIIWDEGHAPGSNSSPHDSGDWARVGFGHPYGADDQRTDFTANRVAIEKIDGTVVKERLRPSEHAEGKAVDAPWDALDRAYFNGYALWTYLTTPFHFAMPGFDVEEIAPWHEHDELWRGLRVTYPPDIASHSRQRDFYFWLRLSAPPARLSCGVLWRVCRSAIRIRAGDGTGNHAAYKEEGVHERWEPIAHSRPIDGLDRYLGYFLSVTLLVELVAAWFLIWCEGRALHGRVTALPMWVSATVRRWIGGQPVLPASGPKPFLRLESESRASSRPASGFGPRDRARPRRRYRNRVGSPRLTPA
jgi:hypothetical protein